MYRILAFALAGAAVVSAASALRVERMAMQEFEDGPLLTASYEFLPGEAAHFMCRLSGFQIDKTNEDNQRVKLSWNLEVFDPKGIPLEKPKSGTIEAVFDWNAGGQTILEESRKMVFYDKPDMRVMDFDVTFKPLTKVTFGDTKEGFFAIRLAAGLDALEPIYREALLLRFHEELSLEEIGRVVGAPVQTVASRIRRGLERLRLHWRGNANGT